MFALNRHVRAVAGPDVQATAFLLPWQRTALLVFVTLIWFGTLDARHLLRSDEGRYAQIAYEMFSSGDWVTIRYQGLKYFEKPPFHLWMTALAYSTFGVGDWQARLWVACSGAIAIVVTALAARRWYGPRLGWLAGLALLAAPTWNVASHFNSLDMGVSAALACVLAALLIAQHPVQTPLMRRRWMWGAWTAMAVAVLTKGLIGIVLPGLALVLYTLLARDWALWTRLCLVSGTALFLFITAPWFVLVSQRNPEFAQFFFIHEHWQRYTSTVHSRSAPAWYFVPQLLAGFLPWLGLLPGMAVALRSESRQGFRPLLFCAVWAAAIFTFFSASGSKLPGYILPMFPALAVLAGVALHGMPARQWRWQVWGLLALSVIALLASPLLGRHADAVVRGYGVWLSAACAVAVVGLSSAAWLQKNGALHKSIVAYALSVFCATTLGLLGHETLGRPASGADLVPTIHKVLTPGMQIYGVRLLDHTLPFYLRHTTVMVEDFDELAFGCEQQPQKCLPTLAAFRTTWDNGTPALALMSADTFTRLQAQQWAMTLVAQDARRVVVANFPGPVK
jgi:4-amino-4-deoxy-L-arabinose transferase-like glycosyltransferase